MEKSNGVASANRIKSRRIMGGSKTASLGKPGLFRARNGMVVQWAITAGPPQRSECGRPVGGCWRAESQLRRKVVMLSNNGVTMGSILRRISDPIAVVLIKIGRTVSAFIAASASRAMQSGSS